MSGEFFRLVSSVHHSPLFKTRLAERGIEDVNGFLAALVKSQGLLAGSFPLQVFLGVDYAGSDIDIYVQAELDAEIPISPIECWIYRTWKNGGKAEVYLIHGVIRTKRIKMNEELNFNLVYVNMPPLTFVETMFDMTMCQTAFDGSTLFYHPLTSLHLGLVVNAPTRAKVFKEYHKRQKTASKSPVEEFSFYPPNIHEILAEKLKQRVKKYEERGFTFISTFDFVVLRKLLV